MQNRIGFILSCVDSQWLTNNVSTMSLVVCEAGKYIKGQDILNVQKRI